MDFADSKFWNYTLQVPLHLAKEGNIFNYDELSGKAKTVVIAAVRQFMMNVYMDSLHRVKKHPYFSDKDIYRCISYWNIKDNPFHELKKKS